MSRKNTALNLKATNLLIYTQQYQHQKIISLHHCLNILQQYHQKILRHLLRRKIWWTVKERKHLETCYEADWCWNQLERAWSLFPYCVNHVKEKLEKKVQTLLLTASQIHQWQIWPIYVGKNYKSWQIIRILLLANISGNCEDSPSTVIKTMRYHFSILKLILNICKVCYCWKNHWEVHLDFEICWKYLRHLYREKQVSSTFMGNTVISDEEGTSRRLSANFDRCWFQPPQYHPFRICSPDFQCL